MNLIKITVKPIKYEMVIEKPRLEKVQNQEVKKDNTENNSNVSSVKSKIKFSTDSYQSNVSSVNKFKMSSNNFISSSSLESSKIAYSRSSSKSYDIDSVKYDKVVNNPDAKMVLLPDVGPQISYIDIPDFSNDVNFDFSMPISDTVYYPGSISLNITQWPSVTIEYLGNKNQLRGSN